MTDDELGCLAYEVWVKAVFHRRNGRDHWNDIPDFIRQGWISVGKAIAEELDKRK